MHFKVQVNFRRQQEWEPWKRIMRASEQERERERERGSEGRETTDDNQDQVPNMDSHPSATAKSHPSESCSQRYYHERKTVKIVDGSLNTHTHTQNLQIPVL